MATEQKNYHLLVGIVALILIILMISVIGYFVSKPKPIVIQGEVEATEYRVSGKVPGRIEELYAREGHWPRPGVRSLPPVPKATWPRRVPAKSRLPAPMSFGSRPRSRKK